MNGRPISNRYRKFAPEYVSNGFNGAKAVYDLGFTKNKRSATVIATRLLANVSCRALIEQHIMSAKISADEVLEELSSMARAPIEPYKVSEAGKLKALELSGKALKLFVDKIESTSTVTTLDPVSIQRSIDKISQKTHQPRSVIAREFLEEWSKTDDPDYSPELHQTIQEIVNSLPVEQIPEQITEIGDQ